MLTLSRDVPLLRMEELVVEKSTKLERVSEEE
jgi:hypothetical protein